MIKKEFFLKRQLSDDFFFNGCNRKRTAKNINKFDYQIAGKTDNK